MRKTSKGGALPTGGGRPIASHGEGRKCVQCGTKLSRYNESDWCGVHRGWGDRPSINRPLAP